MAGGPNRIPERKRHMKRSEYKSDGGVPGRGEATSCLTAICLPFPQCLARKPPDPPVKLGNDVAPFPPHGENSVGYAPATRSGGDKERTA
jgi:hypothetical protein